MPKIRILVVDDAVVFRRLVSEELSRDPALEVVGTAANGRIALAKMAQVSPDLVILDIEMPEMDGLATLAELRKTYPRLPVIMFSSLTERGAEATLDALALGATDYFTKPTSRGAGRFAAGHPGATDPGDQGPVRSARRQAGAKAGRADRCIRPVRGRAAARAVAAPPAPAWPGPGAGHRRFDRRAECPGGGLCAGCRRTFPCPS